MVSRETIIPFAGRRPRMGGQTTIISMQQSCWPRRREYLVEKMKKHSGTQTEQEPSMVSQVPPEKMDLFVEMLNELVEREEIREARLPQEEGLAELRYREPARVERTVEENEEAAVQRGDGFPRYSYRAEPDAQYVAQNPEDAAIVSNHPWTATLWSNTPELSQEEQDVIGRNVAPPPEGVTSGRPIWMSLGRARSATWPASSSSSRRLTASLVLRS